MVSTAAPGLAIFGDELDQQEHVVVVIDGRTPRAFFVFKTG